MSNKQWISTGVTLAMIILGVILIKFLGLWTSIIALCSYFVGKIVGNKTTEPEIIEKIVEKIVEVPNKPKTKKTNKTVKKD